MHGDDEESDFKSNLKIKALSLRCEGKVEDVEEVLKISESIRSPNVRERRCKNKAQFMTNMMKDEIFKSYHYEKSDVVVLEYDMHDPTLNFMFTNKMEGW